MIEREIEDFHGANAADVAVTEKRQNADGSIDIRMVVRAAMQDDIAKGRYDGAFDSRYGVRVGPRRV